MAVWLLVKSVFFLAWMRSLKLTEYLACLSCWQSFTYTNVVAQKYLVTCTDHRAVVRGIVIMSILFICVWLCVWVHRCVWMVCWSGLVPVSFNLALPFPVISVSCKFCSNVYVTTLNRGMKVGQKTDFYFFIYLFIFFWGGCKQELCSSFLIYISVCNGTYSH